MSGKSERVRSIRRMPAEARLVADVRRRLVADVECRRVAPPAWRDGPVALKVGPPRKTDRPLTSLWGVPLALSDLDALPLTPEGGWGVFELPPTPTLYVHAVKASTHTHGLPYLTTLARVVLFSRATLSEAAGFMQDCMALDPVADLAPEGSASAWAQAGVTLINTWQARQQRHAGRHLGDVGRLAEVVMVIRDTAALRLVRQAEIDLENARRGKYRGASRERRAA